MTAATVQFVVMAKEPVPGRVKTRLCPPCTPAEAAAIAVASLRDTLATVADAAACVGGRTVLALDGRPGRWLPPSYAVIPQRGDGLGRRLASAFTDCFADEPLVPVVLVGMDTPQLTVAHLLGAAAALRSHDAVLGPAPDGGYWCIGLRRAVPDAFAGVPMSVDDTAARQLDQLHVCGCSVAELDPLVDVDDVDDARLVAAAIPRSHFGIAVAQVLDGGVLVGVGANGGPTPCPR